MDISHLSDLKKEILSKIGFRVEDHKVNKKGSIYITLEGKKFYFKNDNFEFYVNIRDEYGKNRWLFYINEDEIKNLLEQHFVFVIEDLNVNKVNCFHCDYANVQRIVLDYEVKIKTERCICNYFNVKITVCDVRGD